MKSFTTLKSFAIIAIIAFFITSCSSERYSHLQRGNAKAQDIAKVEKTVPVTAETSVAEATTETPSVAEATSAPALIINFNAAETINNIEKAVVEEKVSNAKISKMFKHLGTKAVFAKISDPFKIVKKSDTNHSKKHETDMVLLIILAILIPPVAVGLVSDWSDSKALIISILLTLCFWIPGIIHAIIYVNNNN